MANTGLALDDRFQEHRTGPGHPERPERLERIASIVAERGLRKACRQVAVSPVDRSLLELVHSPDYIDRVQRECLEGKPFIDAPDSAVCPQSYGAALLAAGCVINAVDDVMAGRIDNAFCAPRPPGHHAESRRSMGFCLFNNIAIAGRYLLDRHELARVLILDWDVHHGNGTQHAFETDPRLLFVSLHGDPEFVYPGTGFAHERGLGEGEGFTINLPMQPPSSDTEWQRAFDDAILPAIEDFGPQFILISAGFDAHRLDPLAPLELSTECFGWMTDQLLNMAKNHCNGRLVSVLEGGYNLDALGDCVALHIARLLH